MSYISLMMKLQDKTGLRRYRWIEAGFFVFIWLIIPLMSDLEYTIKEEPFQFRGQHYGVTMLRRLIWGLIDVWPYVLFYKLSIQALLLRKKYWQFLLSIPAFCVFLEFYMIYILYWPIAHMHFLPEQMVKEAVKWGKGWSHFTISYLLLQFLEMIALAYYIHHDRQERQIQQLRQLQTDTDLQYLKAQLQPHFFFNTLNNIYSLALQQSAETAPMLSRLSDMMRYVLYETAKPKLQLTGEIAFLRDYVLVQSVRFNENIMISFDTQGIKEGVMIEPLLMLPFVENAFKHGVEQEIAEGNVEIIVCLEEMELTVSVKNSKTPHEQGKPGCKPGIGLVNAKRRLGLLYPQRHSLQISETDREYAVILTLML